MMSLFKRPTNLALAGLGLVGLGRRLWQRQAAGDVSLHGQVALVTGSSRGLGFLIARELAREGCRLVICARDEAELVRAQADLAQDGAEVLAVTCDVSDRHQVDRLVAAATERFGRIDILVSNAGVIQGGPLRSMTLEDFEESMAIMFWGMLYPIWAVLPQMLDRRSGRIVNVTSIGGRVGVPHLMPYVAAKFAAVGLSETLHAELARQGVKVTTIIPGLMRTGSYLNAFFKGKHKAEFSIFSVLANAPFVTIDAEQAARQIVAAAKQGEAERTLTLPAILLARFHGMFPGLTAEILGLVTAILPSAPEVGGEKERGMEIQARLEPPLDQLIKALTILGRRAAERLHQYPGPLSQLDEPPAALGDEGANPAA